VYPSRYEGFGLPPLEAMAVGCPVISSKGGSLPEILSDAALFVDLDATESLQMAIDDIIESEALRQTLIEKGRKHCAQFNWKDTALKHAELYKQFS
jgi:glycosyltransferase involved in cell wall biosynthesis